MINKYSIITLAALITTVAVFYFNSNSYSDGSEYELLALADHEKLSSGQFSVHMNTAEPIENSVINITRNSYNTTNFQNHMLAPAINAVAIAKFLNGNLPVTTPVGNASVPLLLSQTGAFSNLNLLSPSPGLIPYDMIEPFWSDGATKKRWMAIPNDGTHDTPQEQITLNDEAWDFPRGAVLIKHFELGGKRLETRFEVKGDDDTYYYLTYKWNEAQTDATLLNDSVDEDVVVNGITQSWHYPSRTECASCHFPQNGSVLGPKTRNLNKAIVYPSSGIQMNQLVNLSELGILTESITDSNVNTYPAVAAKNDLSASLEDRARSYIDVNCASCHNPQVDNIAMFDARFSTPIENQNIIYGDVIYDEGLSNPKVIIPQDVPNSMVHFRMNSTQTGIEMPPLAKDVVDTEGVQLIADWINSLTPTTSSPPIAVFSASIVNGPAPLDVDFDASASTDADGDTLTYSWDFGDGSNAQGLTTNHVYNIPGAYTTTLTVSDGQQSDQETTSIIVNNSSPGTNVVSFTDGTNLIGQDNFSGLAMGVIDMNGDGKDDIVQFNSAKNLRLQYQNSSGQAFTSYNYGQVSNNNQWGTAIADFDQNGYNDIMSGGAYDNLKIITNNNGSNSFSLATLPSSNIFLQGSNFADINNDGWADIFACHDDAESRAYQNNQDGTFSFDANLISTETDPTSDNSGNYASMWIDYDNDRDLDLYISKCRGGVTSSSDPRRINMLWQNDGNNNFTEVAAQANLKIGDQTWLSDFGDIDNDGDLDAIVINHGTGPNLMRNNGDGTFTEVTSGSGLLPTLQPQDFYGIQGFFRDFNNDGHLDLMVSGDNHYIFYNNGDGTFQNAANPFNSNQIQSFSVGDLNHDGFLDLYAGYANGLNSPSSIKDRIWLNEGNSNNFLNIQLKGTQSNINAIGARVEVYGAWGIQIRDVRSGEGYGLVNSFTQHFGIGVNTQIDKVVVRWPSGNVDEVLNPSANQFLVITEILPEPTCNDGIQNGDETGVDCGGSCTNICPCEGEVIVSIGFENGAGNDWTTSGNATTGTFVIADPTAQSASGIQTQLEDDHSPQGSNAFFTATNTSAGGDDVDGGVAIATSPIYNIQDDSELSIWYFFGQRDAGNDSEDYFLLEYSLDGGGTYTSLASYGDETVVAQWTEAVANIPQNSSLVIRVSASDGPTTGDIVEAGIDDLVITAICVDPIAVTGTSLTPESATLLEGATELLTAMVLPLDADDTTVTWSSSDTAIATVDINGLVTAVIAGTATITVTTNDGNFSDTALITVEAIPVDVTGVSLTPESATLLEGTTQLLTATVLPLDADDTTVTWSSSDTAIATVDTNGLVTAVIAGTATIMVTTNDGSFTDTTLITVEAAAIPVAGVSLSPEFVTITEGATQQLAATVSPLDADDPTVSWSSSNEDIVTVDTNGMVTAVAEGAATITVTTNEGNFTASSLITVEANPVPVIGVSVSPLSATVIEGATQLLTATVFPANADDQTLTWTSDDVLVATVDANGLVTGISQGSTSINVITNDGNFIASSLITIEPATISVTGVSVTSPPAPLAVGDTQLLTATISPSDASNSSVSWSSSDQNIATVDINGLVTAIAEGTANITVTTNDGDFTANSTIVVEDICLTNVAPNGTATQSSTYGNGLASYAIDGNTSGSSPWSADLQHTANEATPWWELDLGGEYTIDELNIFNRSDGLQSRLNNFHVFVSDMPFAPGASLEDLTNDAAVFQYYFTGAAGLQENITLNTQGRYLRIQLSGNGILHMAEVQVMGCFLQSSPCDSVDPVTIDSFGPYLDTDAVQNLVGSPVGGTWSGASSDGTFDTSIGAGTYSVTYTYDNGLGCVQSDTKDIVVNTTGTGGCTLTNVAPSGTATQSSTYGRGLASLAIDGDTSGSSPWSADLQHTANEATPWWELDLGGEYTIDELNIFNRSDGLQSRLNNFHVFVSDMPFAPGASLEDLTNDAAVFQYYFTGAAGLQENITLNTQGRYLRIQLSGNGILHMAEVQVMGCFLQSSPCDSVDPVTIDSFGPYLDTDAVQNLVGSPVGGTWSGASSDGTFDTSIGAGTYSVTYTYDNGLGCVQSDTKDIVVNTTGTGGCTLTNVALSGTATQSSTYGRGLASLAIDGDTSGSSPWSADLQHTANEATPWWELDLGGEYTIDELNIFNRSDGFQSRLNNFHVFVSNTPFASGISLEDLTNDAAVFQYYFTGAAGLQENITLNTQGRYLRIQLSGNGILHMAEMQVMGCSSESESSSLRAYIPPSSSLSLSPVPANDILNMDYSFENDSEGAIEMDIFDNIGREIINRTFESQTFNGQVDVTQLPPGVYMLRLIKGEVVLIKRFTIRR